MSEGDTIKQKEETAAEAFNQLRGEVAVFRKVIERVAIEKTEIEIPDYTATLSKMAIGLETTAKQVAWLASRPMLRVTTETLSSEIARAGEHVRRADHDAIAGSAAKLEQVVRDLRFWIASAREAQRQDCIVVFTGLGGMVVGAILWAIVPGAIARMAPASWGWPEKMAAQSLGADPWDAGQRLMMVGDADKWRAIVAAAQSTGKTGKPHDPDRQIGARAKCKRQLADGGGGYAPSRCPSKARVAATRYPVRALTDGEVDTPMAGPFG